MTTPPSTSEQCSARQLIGIAHELTAQPDQAHAMRHLAAIARQLTGCAASAVWQAGPSGLPALRAVATDDDERAITAALAHKIPRLREGVAYESLSTARMVHMANVGTESRWPAYTAALHAAGLDIAAAAGFPLRSGPRQLGALTLYTREPNFFSPATLELGCQLAAQAALALNATTAQEHCAHLERALASNRRIGIAIGILITLHHVSDEDAFHLLRQASQHTHAKPRDVAEEVILTGALPETPPAGTSSTPPAPGPGASRRDQHGRRDRPPHLASAVG